jgi:hypothetical protein
MRRARPEPSFSLVQHEGAVYAVLSKDVESLMFNCRLLLRNESSEVVRNAKVQTPHCSTN